MTFELNIVKWLQENRNGFLDFLFEFFTLFGEEAIIIGVLGLVYWSINKEYGKRLAITIFISAGINSVLKVIIARPRPFLVDDTITNLRPETSSSYSMPSGHTQSAATTFFGLAYFFKKRYLFIFAIIITILVGISRMYIGVHYLSDVLVGGLLGIGIVYGLNYFINRMKKPELLYRLIGAFAFAFLIIFIVIEFVKAKSGTTFDGDLFYFNLETIAKMIGALVGFVVGIEIEQKYVNFENHKNLIRNIIRFVLGIAIVFIIRIVLKEFFSLILSTENLSDQPGLSIIAIFLDFLRYFIMVVIGIGVYPLSFKKFYF
ncbi:MAG: phosphatase PAP2 family protein [Tenericutes bacterium]|jgi:membrane-associated phospholipid phosphatase|nr:phosphatase PAP2 family protein [Mycoplasmatota bacterium]